MNLEDYVAFKIEIVSSNDGFTKEEDPSCIGYSSGVRTVAVVRNMNTGKIVASSDMQKKYTGSILEALIELRHALTYCQFEGKKTWLSFNM
jgi:hypothetical protein